MKRFLLAFLLLSNFVFAQDINRVIEDGRNGKPMLIGYCDRTAFTDSNFASWFDANYKMYEVDSTTLSQIENLDSFDIFIVMGTWCSDSKREVPKFYKILDYMNYPGDKVLLINVNRDKVGLENEVTGLEIEFVPTFIIFNSRGTEAGRIVESPVESLEKDLLKILQKG